MLAIKPRGSEFESAEPMLKPETRYVVLAMLGQGSQRLADLWGSLVGQPSLIMKHSMWALGTELRSPARAVPALSHWDRPPVCFLLEVNWCAERLVEAWDFRGMLAVLFPSN